jgi:hypothetical protein
MWCGFPLFAEGQVGGLYPANVLLFLLLPYDIAVHYGLILHYILAAVFAFWLAREIGFARPAALLAGAVFTLSGMLVVHAIHVNMVRTLAWLPLLLVIVVRAGRSGQPLRSVPALGIVFAMQVFAGFPPSLFLSAAIVVLVAAALPAPNAAWSPSLDPPGERRLPRRGHRARQASRHLLLPAGFIARRRGSEPGELGSPAGDRGTHSVHHAPC